MTKIGIIGGMGTRAGLMLANKITDYSVAGSDQEFFEFILHNNTKVPDRTLAILNRGPSPVPELLRSMRMMDNEEVDVIVVACITASHFFKEVQPFIRAKLIHPIEELQQILKIQYPTCKVIGILATSGSIKSGIFEGLHAEDDLAIRYLPAHVQEEVFMKAIYGPAGMKSGSPSIGATNELRRCITLLVEMGADIVIGGCTELSLIASQQDCSVPYVDMVDLLAQRTVRSLARQHSDTLMIRDQFKNW